MQTIGDLPPELPPGPQTTPQPALLTVSVAQAVRIATGFFEAGNRAEAEGVCLQILAVEPEQADALHICGALAHLAGKHGIALPLLEKAARLQPANAQIQYNLGVVFGALRMHAKAAQCYRATLAAQPTHVNAMQNLGNVHLENEEFTEAQRWYEAALPLMPRNAIIYLSLGLLFNAQRQVERARWFFERALELDPGNARIRWEAAQAFLLLDDFERGWALYEARFPAGNDCKVWCYPYPFPRWQGEPLAGKHILIHGEQGLGDEMMFLSIVPELLAEGARITLVGQPHLHELWRDALPQCKAYVQLRVSEDAWTRIEPDWLAQLEHVDYQIPFGSLALLRRRRVGDFARQRPYIRAADSKSADWRAWLDSRLPPGAGRLRVGLVWAGNPAPNNVVASRKDAKRSLALAEFFALSDIDGVDWVSLQTWQAASQIRDVPAYFRLLDCSERLTDFSQTAALVDNLDLVISVDTSVCHLCAAMGKPAWILLPFIGEWRWGLDAQRSYWWPNARLFRQQSPGAWVAVVERVGRELRTLCAIRAADVSDVSDASDVADRAEADLSTLKASHV